MSVYLDNAATTKQKPPEVFEAVNRYAQEVGCSAARGGYHCSLQASRLVLETRMLLADLFNVGNSEQIIFTPNVTYALNIIFRGLLNPGDHVVTSSMEHNAVIRPLRALEQAGLIELSVVPCNLEGLIDPDRVRLYIKENTVMLVTTHASNVTGGIFPVARLSALARDHDLLYVLDAAQTAGGEVIDSQALDLDVLAFTGHKGLYGPPGTGGFAISERVAKRIRPVICGGTGSRSELQVQPEFLPDMLEAGTQNTWGLAGLKAGVEFVTDTGVVNIRRHKQRLTNLFLEGLREIRQIQVHGPGDAKEQSGVVSITVMNRDLGELSFLLDDEYGIMTRSGLHCAPLAHETIHTFPEGTLRFSFGYFNTVREVEYTVEVLRKIIH